MYSALAQFYEDFADKAYYEKWYAYINGILQEKRFGADIGCGTGLFTRALLRSGKQVVGIDSSGLMLQEAVKKSRENGFDAPYILSDATSFTLNKKAEFITAMCDVVNYLKRPEKFFKNAFDNLLNGGVLIFDISSKYKLCGVIANNTFSESLDTGTYVWKNYLNPSKNFVDMELKYFKKLSDGLYDASYETQRQYVYGENEITDLLRQTGFKVSVYGDLTKTQPKEKSLRIHFKAVKQE